MLNETFQRMHY